MSDTIRTECFDETPTRVVSGEGALGSSPACLAGMGITRALIVCGENVAKLPQIDEFIEACEGCIEIEVFSGTEPDPTDENVVAGGAAGRRFGAEGVIGIGGGSSMDCAKAVAAQVGAEGWIAEQDRPGEPTQIDHEALPIVCVPTTAGTGSEVNPFSVITFTQTERKLVLNHEALYPRCAVLDPTLLTSAPRRVRVGAGLDALTHAVESFVSTRADQSTRKWAGQTIQGVAKFLPRAAEDPEDMQAQAGMQRAAMVASLSFAQTRLGIVHAMALPLSALFGVPHGIANAVLLPHGMRYNCPADPEGFAEIAGLLGEDVEGLSPEAAAALAPQAVERLAAEVDAPTTMGEVGVEASAIQRMADDAMQSAHVHVNPREMSREDVIAVYEAAM
ncbi:MAG: iron-containing alcohol dehydrogenase [Armatimonadota bacterium]|nr:iron-containing alcohol dehydrogenase [Armatimonadota bacterium]